MVKYISWNIPVYSRDSDWFSSVDIPGLIEASRGYDTPMGNPHPSRGFTDPGRLTKSESDKKGIFLILRLVQIFLSLSLCKNWLISLIQNASKDKKIIIV